MTESSPSDWPEVLSYTSYVRPTGILTGPTKGMAKKDPQTLKDYFSPKTDICFANRVASPSLHDSVVLQLLRLISETVVSHFGISVLC